MNTSKKSLPDNFTIAYSIARLIPKLSLGGICVELGISKQHVQYYLKLLMRDSIIEKKKRGIYELTDSGKVFLDEYVNQKRLGENKELIRLENMRYKFPITNGVENLVRKMEWSQIQKMKNFNIYHCIFEGHTIRLFATKNPSIEIYCKQWYDSDIHEMMFNAKIQAILIMDKMAKQFKFAVGEPIPTMKPEFAIPSPLAEAVLTGCSASQVRTPEATFNRSKGRGADIELKNLQDAQKILRIPVKLEVIQEGIDSLENEVINLKNMVKSIQLDTVAVLNQNYKSPFVTS